MTPIDEVRLFLSPQLAQFVGIAVAVVMLGLGMDLRWQEFRQPFREPKGLLVGLFCQVLLLPATAFCLSWLLGFGASVSLGLILIASCPGGSLSNYMTYLARGTTSTSIVMTVLSTLCGIFFVPFNLLFWGSRHPTASVLAKELALNLPLLFVGLVLFLLVPVGVGMASRHFFPAFAEKAGPFVRRLAMLLFSGLVLYLLGMNLKTFWTYGGWVVLAVALVNCMGMVASLGLGWLLGVSRADGRAIAIEVSIQNITVGIGLILGFFQGLGGMLMVAVIWGYWHFLSGFGFVAVCRALDRRAPTEVEALPQ